jgi:RNA 3'-terminal phosphate cyclase (ATP)/RNA 3'-terminal phosphate cyclase (GTP)
MRAIDGSQGEGGGQLVRSACALAALTGQAVRIFNIRARRDPSGLAPQHVAAVKAVAALAQARVEGLGVRAAEIEFHPGPITGGRFVFDVGTAGAITLVLQACVPVAFAAPAPVRLRVHGGSDVRAAPPIDYFRYVLVPLLARMGLSCDVRVLQRGYYPRGGGCVEVDIAPARPQPLRLAQASAVQRIDGVAHVSQLPVRIVERMAQTAERLLAPLAPVYIESQLFGAETAPGPGGAIVLWAQTQDSVLGGAEVAQRGVPAEALATRAADSLRQDLAAGATLDIHAADQLLIYCALADGPSTFLVRELTSHLGTTMWLIEQLLTVRFTSTVQGNAVRVDVHQGAGALGVESMV